MSIATLGIAPHDLGETVRTAPGDEVRHALFGEVEAAAAGLA